MFARNVSLHLKPNSAAEFKRTLENEIIPLLQDKPMLSMPSINKSGSRTRVAVKL
jgi:hypothetical protein